MNLESHPRIKLFLDSVSRCIKSHSSRKNVREELLSHIEMAAEEKLEGGASLDQAIEETLHAFGPTQTLSRELAAAHRPLYLQIPFLAATLATVGIIFVLFILETTRSGFEQARLRTQKSVQLYRDRFLQDQAILSALSFFDFPGRKRDAGVYLNDRLSWSSSDPSLQKYLPQNPPLAFSRNLISRLSGKDWLDQKVDMSALDTSWFSELKRYDHWDLYKTGPLLQLFSQHFDQPFWSMPLPDYTTVTAWSKIRLLRGIRDRKVLPALKDVRQLARLSYTSEVLIGNMVSVAILRQELETYQYAVAHGLLDPREWQPMADDTLIRARRSMYGYTQLFDIWGNPEFLNEVFNGKTAKAGMCSALYERIAMSSGDRYFLENSSILEEDFASRFALLDSLTEQSLKYCRLSPHLLQVWHNPVAAKSWLTPEAVSVGKVTFWAKLKYSYFLRIPVLRRWELANLERQWTVDYLSSQYRKLLLPGEMPIPDEQK